MGRLLWLRSLALDRAAGVRRAGFWQPATCGAAPAALTAYRLRPCVRRVGGTAGVLAPCVGRVSFGLRLVFYNAQLGLAWPSLAQRILGLVRLPRSPSRGGPDRCLGFATVPCWRLLVSLRAASSALTPLWQSWRSQRLRHGQENEVKSACQEAFGCQSQEAERWLLRRRGIGRGLQELRRIQNQGEPAGQSLTWRDRRGQQREAA